jgi:hypothetical protein
MINRKRRENLMTQLMRASPFTMFDMVGMKDCAWRDEER